MVTSSTDPHPFLGSGAPPPLDTAPLSSEASNTPTALQAWIAERFGAYARASLIVGIFLVPLAIGAGVTLDTHPLAELTVAWWMAIIAAAFTLLWSHQQRCWGPLARVGIAALCYLAATAVATALSVAPYASLLGRNGRYGGLIPLALYIATMFIVVRVYAERENAIRRLLVAAVVASALISTYVALQAAGFDWTRWSDNGVPPPFPVGTLGNPDFTGGYLAITLPLSIYIVSSSYRLRVKIVAAIACGLQILALWYTQTRGGLLAAAIAVVLAGGFVLIRRQESKALLVKLSAFLAVVAVICVVVLALPPVSYNGQGLLSSSRNATFSTRLAFWKGATEVFLHHPVAGTGPDTFYMAYLPYRDAGEARSHGSARPDEPHNVFLGIAAGTGTLGFGTYMAVILVTFWLGVRRLWRTRNQPDMMLLALLAALLAYLVQAAFSIDEPPLAAISWVLIAAIAVKSDPAVAQWRARRVLAVIEPNLSTGTSVGRIGAMGLVFGGAVAALVVGTGPIVASVISRTDVVAAMRIQPWEASYPTNAGDLEAEAGTASKSPDIRRKHFTLAEGYYRRALRLQPGRPDLVTDLAILNTVWAETVDSRRYLVAGSLWREAVGIDSNNPDLRSSSVTTFEGMVRAGDAAAAVASSAPSDPERWLVAARAYTAGGEIDKALAALVGAQKADPGNAEAATLFADIQKDSVRPG